MPPPSILAGYDRLLDNDKIIFGFWRPLTSFATVLKVIGKSLAISLLTGVSKTCRTTTIEGAE